MALDDRMGARRLLYSVLRYAFFIASMAYLAHFAYATLQLQGLPDWLSGEALPRIIAASAIFASTILFLIQAWRILLARLSHRVEFRRLAWVLCVTQIAKYLPGNIGHHAGRVVLANSSLGIPSADAIYTILQESALLCVVALLVGTAGYLYLPGPRLPDGIGVEHDVVLLLTILLIAGLGAMACINLWRSHAAPVSSRLAGWLFRVTPDWRTALSTLPYYAAISLINGLAMWVLLGMAASPHLQDLLLLTSAYSLSWMIGFIVPGAPGGLGVREAALTALLSAAYSADLAIGMALLSRVSTIIADLAIFCCGTILALHHRTRSPAGSQGKADIDG